jgi:hypothetical protein
LRGGALPPALLSTALGLALAFTPCRVWALNLIAFSAMALALALAPLSRGALEYVFFGCWASIAATAATVHLKAGLPPRWALALSLNAGSWSGAVIALAGSRLDLLKSLPFVLMLIPAALIVGWRAPIVVKVVASWLIATAILAAALQFLPVTPGYLQDHLE